MSAMANVKEQTKQKIKEPKQYKVIMLNDDFTTMEFVVEVLVDIFKKDEVTAEAIMLKVHNNGSAVVGTYPRDVAYSRVEMALERAQSEGFPFRMTVEEE